MKQSVGFLQSFEARVYKSAQQKIPKNYRTQPNNSYNRYMDP